MRPDAGLEDHPAIHFNPRTPCGVRRGLFQMVSSRRGFQSTHPLRGATFWGSGQKPALCISIHAPLAGCDMLRDAVIVVSSRFQSTHPLRGATTARLRKKRPHQISIHAPLAGCDWPRRCTCPSHREFQSTHPLRGATIAYNAASGNVEFQSTHPLRGATQGA